MHAGEGQARDAAILFSDIRGFTVFAKTVQPDVLMRALAEYQSLMVPIIQRHGGTQHHREGDGEAEHRSCVATPRRERKQRVAGQPGGLWGTLDW